MCLRQGEAIAADTVQLFHERMPQAQLDNLYGPTEATIYATGNNAATRRLDGH